MQGKTNYENKTRGGGVYASWFPDAPQVTNVQSSSEPLLRKSEEMGDEGVQRQAG